MIVWVDEPRGGLSVTWTCHRLVNRYAPTLVALGAVRLDGVACLVEVLADGGSDDGVRVDRSTYTTALCLVQGHDGS